MRHIADGTAAVAGSECETPAAGPAPIAGQVLQYRISTSLFGRRFYVALLAGSENRSTRRLQDEGCLRRLPAVAAEIAILCLALSLLICLIAAAGVIAVYALKSAIGLDLMDGPSPLHPVFEFLFGRG